jgi:hypothetical protein
MSVMTLAYWHLLGAKASRSSLAIGRCNVFGAVALSWRHFDYLAEFLQIL